MRDSKVQVVVEHISVACTGLRKNPRPVADCTGVRQRRPKPFCLCELHVRLLAVCDMHGWENDAGIPNPACAAIDLRLKAAETVAGKLRHCLKDEE